ncbi:hypothetical protein ACFFX1_11225 [Dactylosporangium sucinum]|uniref:Uncharacterized protein n=1 Tax=Dactylosporangium sucinum TaxID=1424081 RepID=A0A917WQ30_9ACTN|nr:type IV secretory system conjugative DNA transfer family protein [Dactylosporangium sucinum]GGM22288.1 hypothetical protein GCM10007977_024320 [Dactylosporangium sucinum]
MVYVQPDPRADRRRATAVYPPYAAPAPSYPDPLGQHAYPAAATADGYADQPPPPPAPSEPPSRPVRRLGRRYLRKQTAPHYTMALLALSATAARAAIDLTGAEAEVAMATAATAFTVAIVASIVAMRRAPSRRDRRWAVVCAAAAATWVSSVAANGMSWDAAGILVAVGTVLALPWWRRHRLPNSPVVEPLVVEDEQDSYQALWGMYCGGNSGGPLRGSWLTGREEIKSGERYVVQLVPGKQSLQTALAALPMLRTGLRLRPGQDLIIEKHPLLDEACLQLTIVTRSPVKQPIGWPGPSAYNPRTGKLALGPFVDGEGVGHWRVCTENSLWGGFLCGGIGSGKSRMFESLALTLAAHGFVIWFGDKQGGASSPLLAKHADYAARSTADIDRMLDVALLVMQLREAENTLEELDGFTHSPARPGLLIFIDECHEPFADPKIQAKATTIAREGRKLGVAIIAASQTGTLDAFGTGPAADTLRSSLMSGNLVVLRCISNNPKNIFGMDIDPKAFPPLPGYGLLVDKSGEGRSAPLRGYDPGDKETRSAFARQVTWRGLDVGAANAAGVLYRDRRLKEQADRAALAAKVAALRAGQPLAADAPGTTTPPKPAQPVLTVVQFPTWPGNQPAAAPAGAPTTANKGDAADRRLTRSHHTVLQAIREGRTTNAEIRRTSGWGETHVRNLLNDLCDWGYLSRRADLYGHYDVTDQAAGLTDDLAAMA